MKTSNIILSISAAVLVVAWVAMSACTVARARRSHDYAVRLVRQMDSARVRVAVTNDAAAVRSRLRDSAYWADNRDRLYFLGVPSPDRIRISGDTIYIFAPELLGDGVLCYVGSVVEAEP